MNDKSCQASGYCQYKIFSGAMYICQYSVYCDYQLPKDSRMQPFTAPQYEYPKIKLGEQTCPYCHLPMSQCGGHTICSNCKKYVAM